MTNCLPLSNQYLNPSIVEIEERITIT